MISVEKALKTILVNFRPLGLEKINILESRGRVIGEDIFSPRNIPSANNSAMDGYAVRYADTKGATKNNPLQLKIIEDIPAGKVALKKIKAGEAARIMTGAVIPEGADAVIRQEDTQKNGKTVIIYSSVQKKENIRFAGEDVKRGELVVKRGSALRPAHIGMLASLGKSFVSVYQKPRVAIMSTGDELVNIETDPPPGKLVNSNSYSLAAQVLECGAIPIMMGITRDRKSDLQKKFKTALDADVIISSGGVSVGDFDFVKNVMGEIGNAMHFWQVAMRPGKPLAFGAIEGVPLFGLPGNPVSAMVSFEQFVRPSLLKMQGHTKIYRQTIKAICTEEFQKKEGFRHFIRAVVKKEKDKYVASTTGDQGSGILKSMVTANGLIVMGENESRIKKGAQVTVQLLDDSLSRSESLQF
ncbi:MAG: molybdopterin molybdotransferase MoeA [Deltaproteobacteria bacterium]|nr:molybdopterin molybdotransferase MoeA [Deltaproteobacteria bacterium]